MAAITQQNAQLDPGGRPIYKKAPNSELSFLRVRQTTSPGWTGLHDAHEIYAFTEKTEYTAHTHTQTPATHTHTEQSHHLALMPESLRWKSYAPQQGLINEIFEHRLHRKLTRAYTGFSIYRIYLQFLQGERGVLKAEHNIKKILTPSTCHDRGRDLLKPKVTVLLFHSFPPSKWEKPNRKHDVT